MRTPLNGLWLVLLIFVVIPVASNIGCQNTTSKPKVITGWLSQDELFDAVRKYRAVFKDYIPNEQAVTVIREFDKEIEMLVFMGTWCPDCQREVPRFLKTVDVVGNPRIHVKILALDRSKRDPDGVAERYSIEYVPTFVLLVDGQEIGRVVERAELSIEDDVALFLSTYKGHGEA